VPRKKISKNTKMKIRLITLVITRNCNLNCSYCYEKKTHRTGKTMDPVLAQEVITRYMEADDEFEGVEIDLFGGEPMLAFPLIRYILEWFHSRTWAKPYKFLIGTNGTILTDEMKNWLYKHRNWVNVGLSIDGNKIAHDISRDNSYDLVSPNIPFFMENWPNQPAKMTIIADTIPYVADSIIELEEMGMNFTANLAFEDFWGDNEKKKRLLDIYEEQLDRLINYYVMRPHLSPVSPLLDAVPEYIGLPVSSEQKEKDCRRFCGAGHEMEAVDVDGKLYPCHRFFPWVTGYPVLKQPVNQQKGWKPEECARCKLIDSCPTCVGFNWEINGDTSIRTTYHCEAYKLEVLASSKLAAIRMGQQSISKLKNLPLKEAYKFKKRLEAVWELIENGI
jgi:uncharacterized protein